MLLPAAMAVVMAQAALSAREFRERVGAGPRMFRLPVENPGGKYFSSNKPARPLAWLGPDHRPASGRNGIMARATCRDYRGRHFPYCYGNHKGTDFILRGGFRAMDRNQGRVVAGADGVVVKVVDGNYDRCRDSIIKMGVSCRGHEKKANYVQVRHDNGFHSLYYHFKKDTIAVKEGERVSCGQFLGYVGSSGESSMPHLHFEVVDPQGFSVDPYSPDPEESMWVEQKGENGLPSPRCADAPQGWRP